MRKISQFILTVLLMTALISHASAAISGQVKDTAGVGVQSTVQLLDATTKQVAASVSSDISGVYNFVSVPAGRFFVRAVPVSSNYLTGETKASFSDGSSNVIVILSASIPSTARYVGVNTACQLCHNNSGIGGTQFNSWKNTWHANAIHEPDPAKQGIAKEGVIGNFSQDPVLSDTANNIRNVTIDLNFDGINYMVKIGNVTYRADKVMGGFWKQRYLTKIGNSFYPLPVQWTVQTQRWVSFDLDKWFKTDGTNAPRYEPGDTPVSKNLTRNSWERRCSGCHAATGLNVSINAQGEYIAAFADMAVSCEGCHGPASEHILAGGGKASNIIVPSLLTYERASEVCGQCHNRGLAVSQPGANAFEYPYNIAQGAYIPGLPLDDFFKNYSMKDAAAGNFWRADRDFPEEGLKQGDAIAGRAHREQWPDLKGAKHDTNSNERVSCANCHAPHGSSNRLGLLEQNRGKIVTNPTSLCLSCHQKMSPFQKNPSLIGIADGDTDHFTGIYDGMSGIGCIECHMVKTDRTAFGPDPVTKEFDQPDHTFKAIKPKFSTNGMPNSCTKCHTTGGAATRSTKWSFAEAQNVYDMTNVSVRDLSSTYVGAGFCKICHTNTTGIPQVYDGWNTTRHASAFNRKFLPAVVNASGNDSIPSVASCRPCHTAGFGKPGGYINFNTTPQLTNIQCENCHGAGSKHEVSANISARVCGECHQGLRRPTITEWEQARHSKARDRFIGTDAAKFTQCLDCHSGDFRLSKNRALITDATNTTKFGVTCAVCHDMHSTVNPRQLRAATPTLMCAQCHFNYDNRGPDSAEPPHNFQVEMREARGGINVTPSIPFMASVGCNECHMFTRGYTSVASPAITGHTFEPNTTACKDCHVRESNQTTFGERHLALGFFKAGRTCDTCHAPGGFSAQGFIDTWKFKVNTEINNTRANITRAGNAATTSASKALFNISRFNFEIVNSSDKTRGAHNPEYALEVLEEANRVASQVISGAVGAVQLYDANSDGIIQKTEAVKAVTDFFSGLITKQQAIDVVIAFFTGSAPSPTPVPSPTAVPPPATTQSFFANLSGAQEVPPTTTTAAGSGTFVLDTAANTLSFNIVFSGLSAPEAGAHIHGPAAAGANAGILNPLPAGSPKTGVWNYLEVQEADILGGRMYVNIHSTTFPGGEIRGQILPASVVEVTSSGFSTSTLTINAGDTVAFVNRDTLSHWPASDVHPTHTLYPESGGCIGSKFDACRGLEQGEIFPFTFNVAGTWTYHDHLSPGFTGTIIVR